MRKNRPHSRISLLSGLAFFSLLVLLANLAAAQDPPVCPDPLPAPYVFLLFDTSGSMNFSTICSQAQIDAAECSFLCPSGDCFVPLQGDDPASKFRQLKEGVQAFLAGQTNAQLGFASYNQDALKVTNKHWMYQAQSAGPSIPGWGPYPAVGAKEVFGFNWGCDTGNNDNEIGCYAAKPADLPDTWELTRVQRLPKGGQTFTQVVVFYVRSGTNTYRVSYTPAFSSLPGAATVTLTSRVDRCANVACSSVVAVGQSTVSWSKVSEFLSWDIADTTNTNRVDPGMDFYGGQAMDVVANNSCSGWDPNTDSASDLSSGYNLRWPNFPDPRGSYLTFGDIVPPDWLNDHNLDVQKRLAPNLATNPMATPDASISPYLRDTRSGVDAFLRLKDENQRPLIASGATPILASLQSFRTWYPNWRNVAIAQDPLFSCRHQALLLLVDGEETCSFNTTCTAASDLFNLYGVKTYAVSFGTAPSSPSSPVYCIAQEGGTTDPLFPQTKSELNTALQGIFTTLQNP